MPTVTTIDTSVATTNPGDHGYDGFVEVGDAAIVNPGITIAAGGAGAHGIFSDVAGAQVGVGAGALISSTQGIGIALTGLLNSTVGASAVLVDGGATVAGAQFGVTMDGGSNLLISSGTIRGATGVKIGSGNLSSGNIIRQSASGSMIGTGTDGTGLMILGDAFVANAGLIQGGGSGIAVALARAFTLVNDGTIRGDTAVNIGSNVLSTSIVNHGRIEGGMYLGNGNSVYEGRNGSVTGTVSMGNGDDKFFGGSGAEVVNLGLGNNRIDGGGAAIVVFQRNLADYTIVSNQDRSFTITAKAGDTTRFCGTCVR